MIGLMAPSVPVLIAADTNYKCPECEVFGYGSSCWLCGSAILLAHKSPPFTCPGSGALTR